MAKFQLTRIPHKGGFKFDQTSIDLINQTLRNHPEFIHERSGLPDVGRAIAFIESHDSQLHEVPVMIEDSEPELNHSHPWRLPE